MDHRLQPGVIHHQWLLKAPAVRPLIRAASVVRVEPAGQNQLKILVMVNTRKNSHVEYLDQVISLSPSDGWVERALDPGPKPQAPSLKHQEMQAPSSKL